MSLFIPRYINFSCNVNKWLSFNTISLNIFDRVPVVYENFRNVEQVKPVVTETPQRSVWRVFGDITKFKGIISVYIMLEFDLQAYTLYSGSRNSSRYTYSMVACVSILPPLTRSYNSAQLTQLIQLGKISNFRPCF